MEALKYCYGCEQDKAFSEFGKQSATKDGLKTKCKLCTKEIDRLRYALNPEKVKASVRRWNVKNREKLREYDKTYRQSPVGRMRKAIRGRIHECVSRIKEHPAKIVSYSNVGCKYAQLKQRIESLWSPGMTWANYGNWHIDHKRPIASFDLSKPDDILAANHFSNLQPLWASENMAKSDKWTPEIVL